MNTGTYEKKGRFVLISVERKFDFCTRFWGSGAGWHGHPPAISMFIINHEC